METYYIQAPLPKAEPRLCVRTFRPRTDEGEGVQRGEGDREAEEEEAEQESTEGKPFPKPRPKKPTKRKKARTPTKPTNGKKARKPLKRKTARRVQSKSSSADGDGKGEGQGDEQESTEGDGGEGEESEEEVEEPEPESETEEESSSTANLQDFHRWQPYYGNLGSNRLNAARYSRQRDFHPFKAQLGKGMQYHLCDTESSLVIEECLQALNRTCPWHDFVQVPPQLAAQAKHDSFGRVCIQAFQPDGCYRPGVVFDEADRKANPQLDSLWTYSLVLSDGPPSLIFPNTKFKGIIRWLFFLRCVCDLHDCRGRLQRW